MTPAKKLITLSEVSRRTGISMPTLQKYKNQHADQIPSHGEGRKQRYYLESLPVFRRLKEEGLARRGKNSKSSGSKKAKSAASTKKSESASGQKTPKGESSELISLQQVMRETGISYPTLLRYVKLFLDQIPHEGEGRKRRYYPQAVEVFRRLRSESRRGRKPKSQTKTSAQKRTASAADGAVAKRLASLERSHAALEKQLRELVSVLRAPMTVTVKRR